MPGAAGLNEHPGVDYTLGEIAARVGGAVRGDAGRRVRGIRPLDEAGPDDLSFVAHPRYRRRAASSRAGALLVSGRDTPSGRDLIVVENPYAALAVAMDLFFPVTRPAPGISQQAWIGEGTTLGEGVSIGPLAVVGCRCVLGEGVALLPGVILGEDVGVGQDSLLHSGVVVYPRSVIGARVVVHSGSVIGSDGFGYAESGGARAKIPQIGNVVIEDDVEIGACVTIDRGTFGSTVIGRGAKIDNLVQVGHNVVIGEDAILVAQSGIAGSTRLGRAVILAGQSGAAGHLTLGDRSVVGAKSAVLQDLPAGSFVVGHPAIDHRLWKVTQAALRRLPDLLHRVARLERALEARAEGAGTGAAGKAARRGPRGRPARRARKKTG
ncbi:MAG TPA: UDP-3-O-(3-hydroxymyristoyl)glucosamine N-acyltransferase [Candidatus Polarisedimenticolia bacterium]|nr:UDP-3-O-(3-hydroxymyristoyl)glucosamine N-acyltransferase [Candidatus Polarisedimenticolia bacterium]